MTTHNICCTLQNGLRVSRYMVGGPGIHGRGARHSHLAILKDPGPRLQQQLRQGVESTQHRILHRQVDTDGAFTDARRPSCSACAPTHMISQSSIPPGHRHSTSDRITENRLLKDESLASSAVFMSDRGRGVPRRPPQWRHVARQAPPRACV